MAACAVICSLSMAYCCICVRACVRACVCVCVRMRACVHVCVGNREETIVRSNSNVVYSNTQPCFITLWIQLPIQRVRVHDCE